MPAEMAWRVTTASAPAALELAGDGPMGVKARNRFRIDAQFRRDPANRARFLQLFREPRGLTHELRVFAIADHPSPASWASRAICTRLLNSSFSSTRETCDLTVATLM